MALLANVLWLVLGGWLLFLFYLLGAVVFFPFFIPLFRLAAYSAWPFGRTVVSQSRLEKYRALVGAQMEVSGFARGLRHTSGVLNVLWFITFGWILALLHIFSAILNIAFFWLIVTIPNIPGHFKLLKVALMPFNKVILPSSVAREIDEKIIKDRHKLDAATAMTPVLVAAAPNTVVEAAQEALPASSAHTNQTSLPITSAPEVASITPESESEFTSGSSAGDALDQDSKTTIEKAKGNVRSFSAGDKPKHVPGDSGKTGLIGALIVLGLVIAAGGWYAHKNKAEHARLMAIANDEIADFSREIAKLEHEKIRMQTTIDMIKQRSEQQRLDFAQQIQSKEEQLQAITSNYDVLKQLTDASIASGLDLRRQVDAIAAKTDALRKRLMEAYSPQETVATDESRSPINSGTVGESVSADRYAASIRECIRSGVSFPTPARLTSENPTALFRVSLDLRGTPLRIALRQSSGNDAFDRAVANGIRLCNPFPRPPSGRYPSYADINYRMYNGNETAARPIEPPLPLANQNYVTCKDVATCVANILVASYPADRTQIERNATQLAGLKQFNRGNRRVARDYNERGLEAFNRGNYRLAADLFRRGVTADPGDIELNANLGFALLRAGDPNAASPPLGDALLLNPRRTASWIPVAEYFVLTNNFDLAVRSLLVAYFYSRNQATTFQFFADRAQSEPNIQLREAYKTAFLVIESNQFGHFIPTAN